MLYWYIYRAEMFQRLCDMARARHLQPPKYELVPIDDYKSAFARTLDPTRYNEAKFIFKF